MNCELDIKYFVSNEVGCLIESLRDDLKKLINLKENSGTDSIKKEEIISDIKEDITAIEQVSNILGWSKVISHLNEIKEYINSF